MEEVNRDGTHTVKIDQIHEKFHDSNMISLGCADFDWACPKEITQALIARANHKCYGYTQEHQSLIQGYINYFKRRHDIEFTKDQMFITAGIVPALAMWLHALLNLDDSSNKSKTVLMVHPDYPPYEKMCLNNGYDMDFVHMCYHEETNRFTLCFKQLEEKMKNARVLLFSSPHNPTSNVFTKEELQKIVDLGVKYNVTILCDEIWADLCFKPFTSILHIATDNVVSFFSTSKTFNCAGLNMGITVTKDQKLIQLFKREQYINWQFGSNVFAIAGVEAALTKCDYYIDLFKKEIYNNYLFVQQYLKENMPKITIPEFESTTLLYLNFEHLFEKCEDAFQFCIDADVYLQSGKDFCNKTKPFLRMNIGSKQHVLKEALERIKVQYDKRGF